MVVFSMMRKLIRITALILALVTIFTGTVSAEEYSDPWISFLDYDTGTALGNTVSVSGSGSLSYSIPSTAYLNLFKGIFQSNGSIDRVTVSYGSYTDEYELELLSIGNNTYRFYSSYRVWATSSVTLHFYTSSSSAVYVELLSFEYSSLRSWNYAETGTVTIGNSSVTQTSTTDKASLYWEAGNYVLYNA